MIQLRKDEHKVKNIYIDGKFMRRMELIGYKTESTIKDGKKTESELRKYK